MFLVHRDLQVAARWSYRALKGGLSANRNEMYGPTRLASRVPRGTPRTLWPSYQESGDINFIGEHEVRKPRCLTLSTPEHVLLRCVMGNKSASTAPQRGH